MCMELPWKKNLEFREKYGYEKENSTDDVFW